MGQKVNSIMARIIPFIVLGVFLLIFIAAIILFSYLFIIGAVIGLVIFCVAYVKGRFAARKKNQPVSEESHSGNTYEHNDKS